MDLCRSCGFTLGESAKYCQDCGSKIIGDRLSIRRLLKDFFQLMTNLESPVIKTSSSLVLDPSRVTVDYIKGKRKVISSPIRFAFIALTIYGLFQFIFQDFLLQLAQGEFLEGIIEGFSDDLDSSSKELARLNGMAKFIQKHNQFTNFFVVPILAFICSRIFKIQGFNYAEHLSISLYAISLSLLFGATLGLLLGSFNSEVIEGVYAAATITINVVLVTRILWKSYDASLIKVIMVFLSAYLLMFILFGIFLMVFSSLA